MPKKGSCEAVIEKRYMAMDYRISGLSYRKIGVLMGVHHGTAYEWVKTELDKIKAECKEKAEELIEVELQRMDDALERVVQSEAYQQGDPSAISAVIRISESRRKLVGADQPAKVDSNATGDLTVRVQYAEPIEPIDDDDD